MIIGIAIMGLTATSPTLKVQIRIFSFFILLHVAFNNAGLRGCGNATSKLFPQAVAALPAILPL